MHIVVIGAGVVGLTLALQLRSRGARVTVLEAAKPGGGVTGQSFAWVNSGGKPTSRGYYELRQRGVTAWHAGISWRSPGFVPSGSLWVSRAGGDPTHEAWIQTLRGWGEPVESVSREHAARLEPSLAGIEGRSVFYFPLDGYVDAGRFVAGIVRQLMAMDVAIRSGVPVERVATTSAGPVALLASGASVSGDAVIVAAGLGSAAITRDVGVGIVVRSPHERGVLGLLAVTSRLTAAPTRVVRVPGLNLRPHGTGRLLLQADDVEETLSVDEDSQIKRGRADELRERLQRLVPSVAAAEVVRVRTPARVVPPDGYPVVGWLDQAGGVYCIVTHSGMTLAPALADLVSEEIIGGQPNAALESYRPRP